MGSCLKKSITITIASLIYTALLCAQPLSSAQEANRQTAIRCLEQCKTFSTRSQWEETWRWAEIGIQYDSAIPDLWYLSALAASHLGKTAAQVLERVETALSGGSWIQYNKNAARILYADLLSDTLEWQRSLSVLNEEPPLNTAEAEYVRAKTWYRLGNPARARAIIRIAISLFPDDPRFPLLFFTTERTMKADRASLELADLLVKNISRWDSLAPEIILYAAPFIPYQEDRRRFVQAFNAAGGVSQLYPALALEYGLIDEDEAFTQVLNMAQQTELDFDLLCEFIGNIKTNTMRMQIEEWLTAFEGTLVFDTNKDGIYDLAADYTRGRASNIRYDRNQNGINTWQALCDFGVPLRIQAQNREIVYGSYPAVRAVTLSKPTGDETYEVNADALIWSPLAMEAVQSPPLMTSFYIPVPKKAYDEITLRELAAFSGVIQVPTVERTDGRIRFTMLNGKPVSAVYTTKSQPYAFASFENGAPKFRNIDANGDGFYELTETYAFNPAQEPFYQTAEERTRLNAILFGTLEAAKGIYLSKVSADLTKNGSVDYESVMFPHGGYCARWKPAGSSGWNITHTKRAVTDSSGIFTGTYTEESFFINPLTREETTVLFSGGIPVSVKTSRGKKEITRDPLYGIYWIGNPADELTAKKITDTLNLYTAPAVSIVENTETNLRVLAVALGSVYFGEVF